MRKNRSIPDATVIPVLVYPDVRAAVAWLEATFGFTERVRIGEDHRAQLRVGEHGAVIVADANEAHGGARTPPTRGIETHAVKIRVEDVDALAARARAHGAVILQEPADQPYGERECEIEDLAGHRWQFDQTLRDVAPEEWGGVTVSP